MTSNTVNSNEFGIGVTSTSPGIETATGNRLSANVLTGNGQAIHVAGQTPGLTLRQNNVDASTTGLGLNATQAQDPVDARHNWWGCPDGPGDPACETVLGPVDVDPWLTSPNSDAGAG